MHGHGRIDIAALDDVVAAAYADNRESLTLQEIHHVLAGWTGQLSHSQVRRSRSRLRASQGGAEDEQVRRPGQRPQ